MINYNRDIANGMSHSEALQKFNTYNETQQSRRAIDLAAVQSLKNPYIRFFTAFASTSILQLNKFMQESYNIFVKGDRSKRAIRSLALNVGIANGLFFAAGNFMRPLAGDEEDKRKFYREFLLYMSGLKMFETAIPFIGSAFGYANNIAMGMNSWDAAKRSSQVINPVIDFGLAFHNMWDETKTTKERAMAEKKMWTKLSYSIGTNIDPFIAMYDLYKDDEDNLDEIGRLFGIGKSAMRDQWDEKEWMRWYNYDTWKAIKEIEESVDEMDVVKESDLMKREAKEDKRELKKKVLNRTGGG